MALYFFHLHNGRDVILDEEGKELADLAAVHGEAVAQARSIIAADAMQGEIDMTLRIEVRDASGSIVLDMPFASAVTISGLPPAEPGR